MISRAHSTLARSVLLAAVPLALAGCASKLEGSDSIFGLITPYRIEIVQGNVVTKEQIALVRIGMTRRQVRDLLGSPLLTDVFHDNRWDYLFTIRRQGSQPQRRSVVVLFEGDLLREVQAPDLPSEQDFVASITRSRTFTPRALELTEEQRKALPLPPPRETPPAEPVGPVRTYPPLESAS